MLSVLGGEGKELKWSKLLKSFDTFDMVNCWCGDSNLIVMGIFDEKWLDLIYF